MLHNAPRRAPHAPTKFQNMWGRSGLPPISSRCQRAYQTRVTFGPVLPCRKKHLATDERVTPLTLDVTSVEQIQRAVDKVDTLDVLINNAGIALYDDLSNSGAIEQSLAVNFFGPLNLTRAFLPLLRRSKGAIVNNLSLSALAALPVIPASSISKAAAFNLTQSQRALLASQGITVHAVVLGPIDTDMNRGFEIPKASPESAAQGIFDGLEKGEDDIFPDPASLSIAEGWRTGAVKALERQFAAFVPSSAA
jgi:NAD(P)-dependent dehydrogenase (short-subunit alcohol dehydrogenase family)